MKGEKFRPPLIKKVDCLKKGNISPCNRPRTKSFKQFLKDSLNAERACYSPYMKNLTEPISTGRGYVFIHLVFPNRNHSLYVTVYLLFIHHWLIYYRFERSWLKLIQESALHAHQLNSVIFICQCFYLRMGKDPVNKGYNESIS